MLVVLRSLLFLLSLSPVKCLPNIAESLQGRAATGNKQGAVATEYTQCTEIGINLLKQGGNAADALVGSVLCVGVLGMYHSGIGGGGFMLVRDSSGKYEFIDFREMAPAGASKQMYRKDYNSSIFGGLASGVPGELRGLEYLHENYGTLPWKTLVEPAMNLARNGFTVTQDLVNYMQEAVQMSGQGNFLVQDPSFAIDFAPNGTRVQLGDHMSRQRYASTLERIGNEGADAFYTGAIANSTITAVQNTGGIMTLEDLKNYTVAIRKPESITYRDYRITSGSAPSSGEVLLAAMKTVEGYDNLGKKSAVNISTHHLDEAIRWAYAERGHLGDPSFVSTVSKYQKKMVTAKVAALTRNKITYYSHPVKYYDPEKFGPLSNHGTSQVAIADQSGMAISLTTTINLLFGSLVCVPETGVIMNDEMNDFSIPGQSNSFGYIASPANYIAAFKRPLSSISPTIVEHLTNGSLYFVTGSAGGSRIITATIQSLWFVLDRGMNAYQALKEPRFHDQLVPNEIDFEYAYNNATVAFMKSRRHRVGYMAPGSSSVQVVRRLPNGTFEAAGEPRQQDSSGMVY